MPSRWNIDAILAKKGVPFDFVVRDPDPRRARRESRRRGANAVAKTVLLIDGDRHALATIPRDHRVDLLTLNREFRRGYRVATPDEIVQLYPGQPLYTLLPGTLSADVEFFVEQSLLDRGAIALQTGDPYRLVRVDSESFSELFDGAWCGRISRAH